MNRIIIVLLFFFFDTAHAQYKKPFFHTLSVENGLPEPYIVSSLQDKLGYMWFGTQNGLVRYDGYQLKPYPVLNDDGVPVSSSIVNYLYEDRSGNLWAFYYQEGLYFYDRSKDVFLKLPLDKQVRDKLKAVDFFRKWIEDKQQQHFHWFFAHYEIEDLHHIYLFNDADHTMEDYSSQGKGKYFIPISHGGADLVQDAHGKMWAIADSLLCYFDWQTRSFTPWFVLPDSTKKFMFSIIVPDPSDPDILWLNTWTPGNDGSSLPRKFLRFNTKTKAYKIFTPPDIAASIPATSYKRIHTDSMGRVWINTKNGIALYNSDSGTFTNFTLNIPSSNNDVPVACVASDAAGNLWIGGSFRGLFYLDVKKGAAIYYPLNEDAGSLPDNNFINKLFFDRNGTFWVNMPYVGIAYLDRQKSLFAAIPAVPPSISQDKKINPGQYKIRGMDGDSVFFVADTAGFFSWNHRQNSFNKIELKNKSLYPAIAVVRRDADGTLWIGSWMGLINYNPVTKAIKTYSHDPNDSASIGSNEIRDLLIDNNGILWVGTNTNGICRFNRETGTFTNLPFIKNNNTLKANGVLDDSRTNSFYLDKEGILWIGTDRGGLNRLETTTGKFTSFHDYKAGFFCIPGILEDSRKQLWAGSYFSGLFLVDKKNGALTRYTEKNGLINNAVMGIQEDAKGNIWVTTARGLSRFDPGAKRFTNYPMGIVIDQNSFYKESTGRFHVVTKKGLVSFDPLRVNESATQPSVIIESVAYHVDADRDTVLFTDGRNKIKLQHNENRVSFNYVALSYENAASNQYVYKLDGFDKNWIQAGIQRTITYTNLSPGTYTFHVKASNSGGVWNEVGASITITILPPWWKTWWAYCLYAFLVIVAGYLIYKYQKYYIVKRERQRSQQIELAQAKEIEKAYTELKTTQAQLIQSEKMASLGELTAGIAHEIQNPLNFVNNFSEVNKELLTEMNDEIERGNLDEVRAIAKDVIDNEEKINHHGKRADAIVKGMLQHSRSSSGVKEPTDINALADEYLRLAYQGLRAKDKSFHATMKTDFDKTIGPVNIIPQDIGRVILNLITNAFYAVDEKAKLTANSYQPMVTVSTKKLNNKVEIRVADNGNGIPSKVLDKIFQPFFTTKPTGQGTGLGLSLSYDIVKAHGGELKVETMEGKETIFIIELPSGAAS